MYTQPKHTANWLHTHACMHVRTRTYARVQTRTHACWQYTQPTTSSCSPVNNLIFFFAHQSIVLSFVLLTSQYFFCSPVNNKPYFLLTSQYFSSFFAHQSIGPWGFSWQAQRYASAAGKAGAPNSDGSRWPGCGPARRWGPLLSRTPWHPA